MSSRPALTRRGSSSTSLAEAQSPTTAHVKAYVRRVSSKQLLVFPEWDIKAMDIEMRRQKEFEECRLRYSKVLGKAWGDESKRKAAEDKAKRELKTKTTDILPSLFQSQFKVTSPRSPKSQRRGSLASQTEIQKQQTAEKPLPPLPVPTLSQTLNTYLKVLKPISTEEQYGTVTQLVKEFQSENGEGEKLQQMLKTRAICRNNWAYDWWLEDMYMLNKSPLPINSNPGMVFPRNHFTHPDDQLRFAARLVSGILDYKVIIDARGLPIDRAHHREKGQPLCMEQYYRLFSTYRMPGVEKDYQKTTDEDTSKDESDHIMVICKNKMYLLDVVNGYNRLTEDDICCQLRRIRNMAEEKTDDYGGVGILTSLPRDKWAEARSMMKIDEVNSESLHLIETSIFIVCLDSASADYNRVQRDDNSLALQMIHGQGSHMNSCNRWYDKTMQFIIGEDGACGLNYEHSPSEGIAVVQLIEHVLKYMEDLKERKVVRMNSNLELPHPTRLDWSISRELIQHIDMARFQMDRSISDLDLYLLCFDTFGKEFPKSQNMSPDCFIQLALQLTYYRLHGSLVSTYESASTRRFRLGRVDNIRSASFEALSWCQSMNDTNNNGDQSTRMSLLRAAMQAQTDYMVQTILGHGMDCHMLGLKRISEEECGTTPALFQDEMWATCNQFTLSTSQVNTSLDSFMGYGPVVPNGYGASYNPQANRIQFCLSAFNACSKTSAQTFGETLESVLLEMRELCLSCPQPSPRDNKIALKTITETNKKEDKSQILSNGIV